MIDRASRISPVRTLWITERSATMAPTPIATQTKKNSSRRQEDAQLARQPSAGRRSRRPPPPPPRVVVRTTRPSRSAIATSATAASSGSCVTSTSVVLRVAVDVEQQLDDLMPGRAVEVAGRLVGEQDRRIVGERAGDRDALLLAARELRRVVMAAIGEADLVQQRLGAGGRPCGRRRSPSARARSRARSATAAGGRTGRRSRCACRGAAPARPRRAR